MKIIDYKKFKRSILLIFLAILIISLFITKTTLSHVEVQYQTIYIENGSTLWEIARELQEDDYYHGKDIRDIIMDLKQINNLNTSTVYENQQLIIPII